MSKTARKTIRGTGAYKFLQKKTTENYSSNKSTNKRRASINTSIPNLSRKKKKKKIRINITGNSQFQKEKGGDYR